jgi:hypothetical protein
MNGQHPGQDAGEPRGWDEVLADAVMVLTEAARLRRPILQQAEDGSWRPDPFRTEPGDWAEFVTLAVAGAAANMGSIDRALEGRPGSWEADVVRGMLVATVGEDLAGLLGHRTEPLRVVLRPAEILADLGYAGLYDDSRRVLREQQDEHLWRYRLGEDGQWLPLDAGAPAYADAFGDRPDLIPGVVPGAVAKVPRSAADEAAYDVLWDQEAALWDLEYEQDPAAYGEALTAAVLTHAAQMYPGVRVEITVDTAERTWRDDSLYWGAVPEEALTDAAIDATPLPWSGMTPRDYPSVQAIAGTERAAGRLPHLRLDQSAASRDDAPGDGS